MPPKAAIKRERDDEPVSIEAFVHLGDPDEIEDDINDAEEFNCFRRLSMLYGSAILWNISETLESYMQRVHDDVDWDAVRADRVVEVDSNSNSLMRSETFSESPTYLAAVRNAVSKAAAVLSEEPPPPRLPDVVPLSPSPSPRAPSTLSLQEVASNDIMTPPPSPHVSPNISSPEARAPSLREPAKRLKLSKGYVSVVKDKDSSELRHMLLELQEELDKVKEDALRCAEEARRSKK
eukprot:PhM_4_TR17391/c2_g1_i1/m.85738